MLCEHCKKREATVKYVEVVNGMRTEHNFCTQCASHIDMGHYSAFFEGELSLGRLLSGLLAMQDQDTDTEPETERFSGVICPTCRTSYEDFVKDSQFGCPDCYGVFGPLIGENIRRLQGSETHVGKKPKFHKLRYQAADPGETDSEAADPGKTNPGEADGPDGTETGGIAQRAKATAEGFGAAGDGAAADAAAFGLLPPEERIQRLQSRLSDAIRVEDYEKAAVLRDQIRALKKEIKQDGKVV